MSSIRPRGAREDARPTGSTGRFEVWRARRLALSVGVVFWGVGAGLLWWLKAVSATVEGSGVVFWTLASALMLAAFIPSIGSHRSLRTGRTLRVADPVAQAWWVLNAYPIFPATGVLFALRDAGMLTWEQQPLGGLVVWAVLLFARGAVLLSPAGPRALQTLEARNGVPAEVARWLVPGAGGAYVLAALVTFAAATTGLFWLGMATALGGLIGIQLGVAVPAYRAERRAVVTPDPEGDGELS